MCGELKDLNVESLQTISMIIGAIVVPYLLYVHKRLYDMQKQISQTLSKEEVDKLIDLKNMPGDVLQRETALDVKEIKEKVDKIVDHMITSK